ncbi:hypothetical protein AVEN_8302-1 [Araneus ventricosus]|uniref:Uncharacterized protein n=1 Tax=Araneus ventricosus TaxID=182803 RepID=A0A4Y2T2U8_ARAVE|nr:hypothetical protein AVEN_8302-1 [Araneus ventricosus]
MGPCDDLPAKPELLHWGTMRRAQREPVTQVCRVSVNSAIKEHGITCRSTAATFGGNASCVRALTSNLLQVRFKFDASNFAMTSQNQTCCKLTCYLGSSSQSLADRVVKTIGLGIGMSGVRIRGCIRTLCLL